MDGGIEVLFILSLCGEHIFSLSGSHDGAKMFIISHCQDQSVCYIINALAVLFINCNLQIMSGGRMGRQIE